MQIHHTTVGYGCGDARLECGDKNRHVTAERQAGDSYLFRIDEIESLQKIDRSLTIPTGLADD